MKKFLLLILVFPFFSLAQTINSIEHYPSINLESGWNMIGYTCLDPMNVEDALISLGDTVLIVKDNNGNVYLPEFNFNGIEQFEFGFGYQLKLSQAVFNFSFCPFLVPLVEGCTDATAFNFNPSANWDDGSCIPFLYGCTDSLAFNFDSSANSDDYSCFPVVFGCTDSASYNYNDFDSDGLPNELTGINGVDVNTENGSCIPFIYGCTDQAAFNYNPQANTSDLNDLYCIPVITGCNIPTAYNFNDYDNDGEPNEYTGNASIDVNTYEINSCIDKVYGCTDSNALNFSNEANTNDGSCIPYIYGCTDSLAYNYSILANTDDNSCIPFVYGCTDSTALNFFNEANTDDESCIAIVYGCSDSTAFNYDIDANVEDGSCVPFIYGCTDQSAYNYNPQANTTELNDLYCIPIITGCNIPTAYNFNDYDNDGEPNEYTGNPSIDVNTYEINSCIDKLYGCTDSTALNFFNEANTNDGSCIPYIYGCTDSLAFNYAILANTDDNSCIPFVYGCTDSTAINYSLESNTDDGSCIPKVFGCMDSLACNYNPEANMADGSCEYALLGYDCDGNITEYIVGMEAEGGIVFYVDETGEHGLVSAMEDLEWTYEWGCYGTSISGADGTSIGTGYQNTMDIVNQGCETDFGGITAGITAAQAAYDAEINGYSDWYLPSFDELYEMYYTIGGGGSNGNIGGFKTSGNTAYWSSSEGTTNFAWTVSFYSGSAESVNATPKSNVRVIRAFGYTLGCMDSLACNFNPEANMSDSSCEYPDLGYDCDGNFVEYIVGMEAEGGIVFYVDETGQHGLVAAMEDLTEGTSDNSETVSIGYEWGCFGDYYFGADGQTIGTGYQNTIDIVNQGCVTDNGGITAAQAALLYESEGYSDWYLPSTDELLEIYNTIGSGGPEGDIGGFENDWYWSSTENNYTNFAWDVNFSDGSNIVGNGGTKNHTKRVRVIRAFGDFPMIGCIDSNATNFNLAATIAGIDEYGSSICVYASCDDVPFPGCIFNGDSFAQFNADFTADQCLEYGGSPCDGSTSVEYICTDSTALAGSYFPYGDVESNLYIGDSTFTANDWLVDNSTCMYSQVFVCMDSLACNYNPDANMADGSCEYPDLGYDCDGNFVEYVVGMEAEGGIVFYVDETGEHGLVAALEDLEGTHKWGCYEQEVNGADGQAIGTGYQNTMDIVNQGCVTVNDSIAAAQVAFDAEINGYSDWYLPSIYELIEMYNTIGNGSPEGNIGGFENDWYWSSSETNNYSAWSVNFFDGFGSGYTTSHLKNSTGRVRVIRAF